MGTVHPSPYSGTWYPGEAVELRALLDRSFHSSSQRTGRYVRPRATAFVVPHAGIAYSGTVAGAAYRHALAAGVSRVILLGFAHHGGVDGIAVPDVDAVRTPLGETHIDHATTATLVEHGVARRVSETVLCDHSVEIQLPFLQALLPKAKFVPLFVGRLRAEQRLAAARLLAGLATPGTAFIASSDFTHYGSGFHFEPFPVDSRTPERLREVDYGAIEAASSLDAEVFFDELSRTGSTVCGTAPVSLLLETLRARHGPELFQETLDYQTSGEITGDFGHSVSYAALGYFPFDAFHLDEQDRGALIEAALRTLATLRTTGRREPAIPEGASDAVQWRGGVFVSVYHEGELRGCVGRHVACEPLAEAVPDLTLSAACDDSRFLKAAGESLDVEISVLTPLKRVRDASAVRAGEHGVYLEAGAHRGLLLPQVASERNWSRERFLDALAQKAGARPDVLQDPAARLSVFRAQIFGNARKRPK